jgi:hypothetical protein
VGFNRITVDDSTDTRARTVTLSTSTTANDSEVGGELFGGISGLAPADINYEYADTRNITIDTGDGGDTINVLATGATTNLVGTSSTLTDTTVNVGDAGDLQNIQGTLNIENPVWLNQITVDDSADTGARTVTLDTTTSATDSQGNTDVYGRISGLAPGLFVDAPEFGATFEVYGNCPVQGFGTVIGRELYFRARHGGWSFDVADSDGRLPSDGYQHSDGFFRQGEYNNAGWMPHREVVRLMERCLGEYTGTRSAVSF